MDASQKMLLNSIDFCKRPKMISPIGKTALGNFPLKVFKNWTSFLKFVSIDSDGHRQQILIIPAHFDHFPEKSLQISRGGNSVGPAGGYQSMIGG